jgi:hypothetical protein
MKKTIASALLGTVLASHAFAFDPQQCHSIQADNERLHASLSSAFDTWSNGRPAPAAMPAKLDTRTIDVFNLVNLIDHRIKVLKEHCPSAAHQALLVSESARMDAVRTKMSAPIERLYEMVESQFIEWEKKLSVGK